MLFVAKSTFLQILSDYLAKENRRLSPAADNPYPVLDCIDNDLCNEECEEDPCRDVDVLELSAESLEYDIEDDAEHDTVGDGVCDNHHEDTHECRDAFGEVVEVD